MTNKIAIDGADPTGYIMTRAFQKAQRDDLSNIASDTFTHRKIPGSMRRLYFVIDSTFNLFAKMEKLILDKNLRDILSTNVFNWVENLTYENRVYRILQQVESQI